MAARFGLSPDKVHRIMITADLSEEIADSGEPDKWKIAYIRAAWETLGEKGHSGPE